MKKRQYRTVLFLINPHGELLFENIDGINQDISIRNALRGNLVLQNRNKVSEYDIKSIISKMLKIEDDSCFHVIDVGTLELKTIEVEEKIIIIDKAEVFNENMMLSIKPIIYIGDEYEVLPKYRFRNGDYRFLTVNRTNDRRQHWYSVDSILKKKGD